MDLTQSQPSTLAEPGGQPSSAQISPATHTFEPSSSVCQVRKIFSLVEVFKVL